jgi:glycerophosphoryl diester phosphodiesterase
MNKFEYKNLTPFKWFVLENFPFIEADFDALTEWQLFCKLGKEMNKIITSENTLGTQVESVTNAFIELQNYVNNYFDNLDIQEEVNEKLNQMAQSGELTEIIAQYLELQGLLCFNTINDLKNADNLVNGSFVKTYGKNNYLDGLGEFYKIRILTSADVVDNESIIALTNYPTLIAEKIPNATITNILNEIEIIKNQILNIETTPMKRLKIVKPKYIAHRGASLEAPENTIPAFRIAGQHKYYGCETDIIESADGQFFCFHDDTVDRMTDGTGNIRNMTASKINIDAGNNISSFENLKIPTFEEYLRICFSENMIPVIEIKNITNIENLFNIIKENGFEEKCIVISFSLSHLINLRNLSEKIKIQALLNLSEENIAYCVEHNFDIDSEISVVTENLVNLAHSNGLEVNVWTIENSSYAGNLRNWFVDYITTNTDDFCVTNNLEPLYENNGIKLWLPKEFNEVAINGSDYYNGELKTMLGRAYGITTTQFPKLLIFSGNREICLNKIKLRSSSVINYNIPSGYKMTIQPYNSNNLFIQDLRLV